MFSWNYSFWSDISKFREATGGHSRRLKNLYTNPVSRSFYSKVLLMKSLACCPYHSLSLPFIVPVFCVFPFVASVVVNSISHLHLQGQALLELESPSVQKISRALGGRMVMPSAQRANDTLILAAIKSYYSLSRHASSQLPTDPKVSPPSECYPTNYHHTPTLTI